MGDASAPNSRAAITERQEAGEIPWSGPVLMLLARSGLAIVAQGLVAIVLAVQGSASPWREGIRLIDLTGFDRKRFGRDVLFGLALIPPSLLLILAGNYGSSLIAFGNLDAPDILGPLPLPAALYAVLVFPLVWGITEQATYNGYVLPRFQALSGSTAFAVAAVAFFWSFQHALMPLTFEPDFMLYRALAPIPFSAFQALLYLRIRRIVPFATAHWLMDGGDAFYRTLWPLLG